MAYSTVSDLLFGAGQNANTANGGVYTKLANRGDVAIKGPQKVVDAVVELSADYPFEDLETTGPTIALTAGQYSYPFSTWINNDDQLGNLIPSFVMYYTTVLNQSGQNPTVSLKYKSISALEIMFNVPGVPSYWTRYQNKIFVAPCPDNNYLSYLRYQVLHPFSNPVSLNDPIKLPSNWREIIEQSAEMRLAGDLRMLDYANSYKVALFGDPKKPGDLGLIKARVTAQESDIVSNQGLRSIRPMGRRR